MLINTCDGKWWEKHVIISERYASYICTIQVHTKCADFFLIDSMYTFGCTFTNLNSSSEETGPVYNLFVWRDTLTE